jgi:hypothetical protein
MRAGRSGSPRTAGQSIMICIQFIISMLLTFAVLGAFYILNELADAKYGGVEEDKAPYRNVIMAGLFSMDDNIPGFKDKLMQTGLVEHIGKYFYTMGATIGPDYDKELFVRTRLMRNENLDTIYGVSVLTTDEVTLDLLKVKITAEKPTDEKLQAVTCALYVRSEEVERLREKWNLPISSDVQTRNLYRGNDYTLIGYAMSLMGSRTDHFGVPSYWVVEPDVYRDKTAWTVPIPNVNTYGPHDHYLIFPKEGQYNEVMEALTDIYREAKPGDMNPLKVDDLYETWFKEIRLIEMMRKLCFMLVVVSILCIMASVYSAISLESRGRQKEVALRKIHGAHTRDIIHLFGNYYLRLLGISALVVSILSLPFIIMIVNNKGLMTEMALTTRNMNYLNSFDKMQKFLKIAIRNRKRNKKGLCEAFKVVVRAGCLNNPEKKELFIEESEPLLQEGTPEALRKVAGVLGLKVPSNFGKPVRRKSKDSVVFTNYTQQQKTQHINAYAG